jgi:ribose-phosphate pyrophosphokinase
MTASWNCSLCALLVKAVQRNLSQVCEIPCKSLKILLTVLAVMPYFPYARQSKKKSHRGAITARMLANLLHVAGVDHVITIDLHSAPMQGFFKCPVDNLVAEPLLANWIRRNVPDWKEGVVVSKNPGGTRRVTSLADGLELDFAIVTTDRRRQPVYHDSWDGSSAVFEKLEEAKALQDAEEAEKPNESNSEDPTATNPDTERTVPPSPRHNLHRRRTTSNDPRRRAQVSRDIPTSPLAKSARPGELPDLLEGTELTRARTAPASETEYDKEEFTDEVCFSPSCNKYMG